MYPPLYLLPWCSPQVCHVAFNHPALPFLSYLPPTRSAGFNIIGAIFHLSPQSVYLTMKMMPLFTILVCLSLPFIFTSIQAQSLKQKDKDAILSIMNRQEECWNAGDLACFMNGYWENDALKFIGKSGITYGWDATLKRYQKSYPDKAAMGKLTFTILHLEALSKKNMLVVGKWHLQRKSDAPAGHFSLNWKKIKGKWVIVADHSS